MRSFAFLVLAAAVAANPLSGNAGADADDSWWIGEVAETGSFLQDRLSEAQKFLADQNDDTFDFQEWYEGQMDDFQADQENVDYEDDEDRQDDLDDFTQQLNGIATEFASAQGEDYADFVRDIVGEGIDHLHDQGQELLNRMQETAQDINDLEEQEYDIYVQLAKISCIGTEGNVVEVGEGGNEWTEDPVYKADPATNKFGTDAVPLTVHQPSGIKAHSTCQLMAIKEELDEYYRKYNKAPNNTGRNKWRKKITAAAKKWRTYVSKWEKLVHTFTDVQQKEEHEEQEYEQYEDLLHKSQDLQEMGMQGSDALVLNDNLLPTEEPESDEAAELDPTEV